MKKQKLLGIFSLRISTYIRYVLLVFIMYGSFVIISLYISYLTKNTFQNLVFWFFILAIFDQLLIFLENLITSNSLSENCGGN